MSAGGLSGNTASKTSWLLIETALEEKESTDVSRVGQEPAHLLGSGKETDFKRGLLEGVLSNEYGFQQSVKKYPASRNRAVSEWVITRHKVSYHGHKASQAGCNQAY